MKNEIKLTLPTSAEGAMSALASLLFLIQNKFIEQLGSIYGMLMTTFDPNELPLMRSYAINRQDFIDFAKTEKLIKNTLLLESKNLLSGLNTIDMICMFNYYYQEYFSLVVEIDECPITFKTFKTWLEFFKQEGVAEGERSSLMKNIPIGHPMQIFFARSNKHINSLVASALKKSNCDAMM
jgi:hypothetical protein